MTQFFLNESLSEVRQAGGDKKGGEFQNVGDKICPPGEIGLRDLPKSGGIAPPQPPTHLPPRFRQPWGDWKDWKSNT